MNYVNTWGVYQCFKGIDDEMVDNDCREEFFLLQPNGKVFECIESNEGIIVLKYGEKTYAVNEKLYKVVKEPRYKVGDNVEIMENGLIGQIVDVNWHFKDDAPFYTIKVNGKKSGKRYTDDNLKKVK